MLSALRIVTKNHNLFIFNSILLDVVLLFLQDIMVRSPVDEVTKEEGGWKQFPGDTVYVMKVLKSPSIEVRPLQPPVPIAETSTSLEGLLYRDEVVRGAVATVNVIVCGGERPGRSRVADRSLQRGIIRVAVSVGMVKVVM